MTDTKSTMDELHDKALERARFIVRAFVEATPTSNNEAMLLGVAFMAAADALRDEADAVAEARRKSHVSVSKELRMVAARVVGIAQNLAEIAKEPGMDETEQPATVAEDVAHETDRDETGMRERYTPETDPVTSHADVMAYLGGETDTLPEPAPRTLVEATDQAIEREYERAIAELGLSQNVINYMENDMLRFEDPLPPSEVFGGPKLPPGVSINDRRTFADLTKPVDSSSFPDHWSWSQLTQSEDCGVQSRLARLEGVKQVPQWANVGGTAFHAASEAFDRAAWQAGGADRLAETHEELIRQRWTDALAAEVRRVAMETGIEPGEEGQNWRASNRGKENWNWWKVEGEYMLAWYVALRRKLDKAAREAGTLAQPLVLAPGTDLVIIEHEYLRPQQTPAGVLQVNGVIDRAYRCSDGSIIIKDLKTSSRVDGDSTGQLGEYSWALMYLMFGAYPAPGQPVETIVRGCFYDARGGIFTEPVDLLAKHPYEEYAFRYGAAEAHRRLGIMQPHRSSFCKSCSVAWACPVGGA